jgi:hypothetical protein
MREWRRNRPQTEEERRRSITRAYTNVLVKRGHLKKLPCRKCGALEVQAHHPDYSDPRRVVWLCVEHHRALHKSLGPVKRETFSV